MKDKIENIKELMELNGGKKSYENSIMGIIDSIKHLVPNYEDGKFKSEDLNDIIEDIYAQVIPIYDKNFTNEEIVGIIEFFKTPIGKSYLSKMGAVALESMHIGNKHGEIVYNKLIEIFKNE